MLALLADVNAEGHLDALLAVCRSAQWIEFWQDLGMGVRRFADFGLDRRTPDAVLWHFCQQHDLLLVTANRNADDPDSLQATIAVAGSAQSLPVLTIANARRLHRDRAYCERAATRLLDILTDVGALRGTGRLWLP
jgi:hypothetical protein